MLAQQLKYLNIIKKSFMRKSITLLTLLILTGVGGWLYQKNTTPTTTTPEVEQEPPRGIIKAVKYYHEMKQNPETGEISLKDIQKAREQAEKLTAEKSLCTTDPFTQLQWEDLGPNNVGGRTRTMVIDKDDPNKLYTGGVAGGIWMSDNAGGNWYQYSGNESLLSPAVGSMIQGADGTIFVGTGEGVPERFGGDGIANSFVTGTGIYRSTDRGLTFELLNSTKPNFGSTTNPGSVDWATVNMLAAHPTDANKIYAATNNGLFMTTDKGETWTRPGGLTNNNGRGDDVKVDANGKVYTVIGGAVYASTDGSNFSSISNQNGLPSIIRRGKLDVSPSDPNYVYVVNIRTDGCMEATYQSTDGGQNWASIGDGDGGDSGAGFLNPCSFCQCWYDLAVAVDPHNPERIWVGGVGLYSWSSDDGWNNIDNLFEDPSNLYYIHADKHEIIFDRSNPKVAYVLTDGGVFRSPNADQTQPIFRSSNRNYNVTQMYGIGADYQGRVVGGTQDNGSPYLGYDFNSSYSSVEVQGGDGGYSEISSIERVNPETGELLPNVMFVESQNGAMRRSGNGGESFSGFLDPDMQDEEQNLAGGPFVTEFFLWENLERYYSGDGVIETKFFTGGTDRRIWMTNESLNTSSIPSDWRVVGRFASGGSHLTGLAVTGDGNTAYGVSAGGRAIRILNLNTESPSAANISSSQFSGRYLTGIDVNPANPNQIVVVAGNYGRINHVYLSENALSGADFTSIQGDLPDMPVYDVIINPGSQEHNIIIGTELGIWTYNSVGQCWQEQNAGLGRVPVYRLRFEDVRQVGCKILYAGTHGRGILRSTDFTIAGFCDTSLPDGGTPTGLANNPTASLHTVKVMPNPMKEQTTIEVNLAKVENAILAIYDMKGSKIKELPIENTIGKQAITLTREGLTAGIYIVSLQTDNEQVTAKLIVTK